jgi:hypothetical protein
LQLVTVRGWFSLRPRWLQVRSGVRACLLLADSLPGRLQEWAVEVGVPVEEGGPEMDTENRNER